MSSCTLVTRFWLPRACLHLLNTIYLDSQWRTDAFSQALTLTPILGLRVHYLSISSKSNESAAHEWIHRILLFLPPLIPHMHSIAFTNLPILHPSFIALASKFTSVKSLELYSFKAQSFGEIIRLVNRYSNLEQLSIVDCKWNTPTYYVSERQHNITNLTLRNRAKCQRDALTWALTSCSTLTLRQFTCLISNPATVELEEERVLKTCQSTLQEMAVVGSF